MVLRIGKGSMKIMTQELICRTSDLSLAIPFFHQGINFVPRELLWAYPTLFQPNF